MSEQMKKLVEEIQDIYRAGKEGRLPSISPQRLIARIGKAYADGELELPGFEWRADFRGYMDREAAVIDGHLTNWEGDELKPICRLIALRPLTGTGKEEKK